MGYNISASVEGKSNYRVIEPEFTFTIIGKVLN